jgi:hypothetical protein
MRPMGNLSSGEASVKLTPITGRVSRAKKGVPVHVCATCRPPKASSSRIPSCSVEALLLTMSQDIHEGRTPQASPTKPQDTWVCLYVSRMRQGFPPGGSASPSHDTAVSIALLV